jgi:hypothetical protein
VGQHAGQLATLEHHTPAGARAGDLDFGEMLRRAQVLAKSGLVPKSLQGNPESIVLVGALGAELGIPFVTALSEIHVIEGRPSPSAQMRLALVRRAGHEAEFLETSDERAVIRGRRRERRNDADGWVIVSWTTEQAQRAGLLDRWVEKWLPNDEGRKVKNVVVVGDRDGIFTAEERSRRGLPKEIPAWARKALDAGEVKQKDNWVKYPADMLRARAASVLCRMAFSDVLNGLGVDPHTADEVGIVIGQDVDEPPADEDDDVVDGEIIEQGEDPGLTPEQMSGGAGEAKPGVADPKVDPAPSGPIAGDEPEEVDNGGAALVGASTAPLPRLATGAVAWADVAQLHEIKPSKLLTKAREFAVARGLEQPLALEDVKDEQLEADLVDWLGPA